MSRDIELEKRIDAYINGRLNDEQAEQLWEALLERPDYIELLKTELGVKSILEEQSSSPNQPGVHESTVRYVLWRNWKWIATAAAVALLVVGINFFRTDTNQTLQELAIPNINTAKHLASAQIVRSAGEKIGRADLLLNKGFKAALHGKKKKALDLYNKVITNFGDKPAAAKAYLNEGILLYNNGKFKNARDSFRHAISKDGHQSAIKEQAYWYLGNAYMNLEKPKKARSAIHKVYSMNGAYRKPAFKLLRKLDYKLDNVSFDDFEQQSSGR